MGAPSRKGGREGSVAARVVAGSGVAGFGGWQPGWKHANDPLIPSRDIGPLTHASAGDPSGAARNMPSQLFDSTSQSLLYLSLSFALLQSRSFTLARLSSSFAFNRTCLLSAFISFLFLFIQSVFLSSVEERKKKRERARVSCSFYCLYTYIPVSVRSLSFTFSFYCA